MTEASDEIKRFLREAASKGGKERAKRHSKAELTEWAKKGGWPKGRPRWKQTNNAAERQKG